MVSSWSSRSDLELLAEAARTPEAFRELYLRHEPIVVAFLQRRTRNSELTADLTAETFATALLRAERFTTDGSAVGWLLGIARNLHLHQLRSARAETRALSRLGLERPQPDDAALARVELILDGDQPSGALADALAALPPAQREAVLALVLGERSYAQIADSLGVEQATVRQRVSRGLARLRLSLEAEGPRS